MDRPWVWQHSFVEIDIFYRHSLPSADSRRTETVAGEKMCKKTAKLDTEICSFTMLSKMKCKCFRHANTES